MFKTWIGPGSDPHISASKHLENMPLSQKLVDPSIRALRMPGFTIVEGVRTICLHLILL